MRVPIVGIGASAGGLEAFTELLKHLPADTGMGFVLLQHLDPSRESALTGLLRRASPLPVTEVTNNLRVEPNRVYVIPPNRSMTIADGVLKLQPRQHASVHRPIDLFLESLAQDQRERAIGVILSGTASDGTLGLEAIKAEGGITFAQDESAKYDSMPRSAILAGCVDLVLSPPNIAKELTHIARHPYVGAAGLRTAADVEGTEATETALPARGRDFPRSEARAAEGKGENGFRIILQLLRNHSGVDFSLYKHSTIERRITRRVVLKRMNTLDAYAKFLRGNNEELEALSSDALISVTTFFRNPEAFEVLKRVVFPRLIRERKDEPVRAWVLGCSTGQEAYSVAMAFTEFSESVPAAPRLQIFATDLSAAVLDKARRGIYPKSLVQDVSPQRLGRFFVEEEGGYRIGKPLRDMVVFARQDLLKDPPFSRMDLICCRNVLIYFEPSAHKKAIPTFHYALKPNGYLFLGPSESVSQFTDLFEPVDKRHKIYSRKPGLPATLSARFSAAHPAAQGGIPASKPAVAPEGFHAEIATAREADRVALGRYAPPGVLVNRELQILQFRGDTSPYMKPPAGEARFNVLKMAREGLILPLREAIQQAKKQNKVVRRENMRVNENGQTRANVEVIPLRNLKEWCCWIFFEEGGARGARAPEPPAREAPSKTRGASGERRIAELERELAATRDYLQSIQEQHEAANEELQATNEEFTSANEELQSLNEELETSKEELESANEELTTVNEEMANRNAELSRLNDDLVNFQGSANLAIVLAGRDLSIRRFTPQAERKLALRDTDVGHPISALRRNLDLPGLEEFVAEVMEIAGERGREVRDKEGRWYSLRVRPYLTHDNQVDGAVLVLVDIDELKRSEQAIAEARDYAETIIRTVPNPLVILSAGLRVQSANEAFYNAFKVSPEETEGRWVFELDRGQWDIPKLREFLEDIIPRNSFFNDFEVTHEFEGIGRRTLLLNARTLSDSDGRPRQILLGIQDITEVLAFQTELRRSELRYRRLFEAAHDGVLLIDPATRKILDANPFMTELLGYTGEELQGKELFEIGLFEDQQAGQAAFQQLQEHGQIRYDDLPLETKAGQRRDVELVCNLYQEGQEKIIECNIRDITERKQAEEALRQSERRHQEAIRLLSTPVLAIGEGLLVVPLVGEFDGQRVSQLKQQLLGAIRKHRAHAVVVDITGVATLDAAVAGHLMQLVEASRLLGGRTIISGVSSQIARTLVELGVPLSALTTVGDLRTAIEEGQRKMAMKAPSW